MSFQQGQNYREAVMFDFDKAIRLAKRAGRRARRRHVDDDLVSFEAIRSSLHTLGEAFAGCKSIPVEKIVGSEDRAEDFNREFLPRKPFMKSRWSGIAAAFKEDKAIPPIKVLEIGGVYFIRDGNHRVSVARLQKRAYIDAEIVSVKTDRAVDVADLLAS